MQKEKQAGRQLSDFEVLFWAVWFGASALSVGFCTSYVLLHGCHLPKEMTTGLIIASVPLSAYLFIVTADSQAAFLTIVARAVRERASRSGLKARVTSEADLHRW